MVGEMVREDGGGGKSNLASPRFCYKCHVTKTKEKVDNSVYVSVYLSILDEVDHKSQTLHQ